MMARSVAGILLLTCFISLACAQDDYLDPSNGGANRAAVEEIGGAMQSDIFNIGAHSGIASTTPQGSRAPSGVVRLGGQQAQMQQSQVPVAASSTQQAPANVAGRWRLEMADAASRSVELALYQSEDAMFGRGIMTLGNDTQEVAASGSALGNKLVLDLVSIRDLSMFRLLMTVDARSASGNYNVFSASDPGARSGSVRGRRLA